ncbi:MAG: ROK family protein [Dysgonamonadaceae bacterium]|jgi:predicted NBD/HSP70 family sugar kinase/mannose-6-phosphate isomerase class I|nr:ROK family protein [Dysgonamonadaceae bacterium]
MSRNYYIGADIGGSHISCAAVDILNGEIRGEIQKIYVDCNGSSSEILKSWETAILDTVSRNKEENILGIGIAMPGPFDYEKGISFIEGVQKYDSLFGLNIREALRFVSNEKKTDSVFINDASAFALGEYHAGAAKGSRKALIVTLGTGFGSTFLINGEIQQTSSDIIPENGYLYNIPFGKSIADDYFSTRWFVYRWKEKTGLDISGVKNIVQHASEGDKNALDLFKEFSDNLAEFIFPWLQKFNPDVVVIGGNIAKASGFFLEDFKNTLDKKGTLNTQVKICELWDKAPLIGAAMNVGSSLNRQEMGDKIEWRKTTQFLAPEKSTVSHQGDYDIYPAFPVGTGKIKEGVEALADWIAQHEQVVIDGYVGVFWEQLVESINIELNKKGKKAYWHHISAAMRPLNEINEMVAPFLGGDDPVFGKITDKKLIDWFDEDKLKKIKPVATDGINILVGCGAALAGWNVPLIYVDLPKNELQFRMRSGMVTNLGVDKPEDNRQMYKRFYFVDWRVLNEHKCNLLPRIDLVVDEQRPDKILMMSGTDLRQGLTAMSKNFFRVRPWFEPGVWGGQWIKSRIEGLNKDTSNLAWSFELMVLENGLMFESDDFRLEVSFDFLMYNNYKEVLGDCAERFKYDFPIRFDFLDTFDGGNLSVQCHPSNEYMKKEFGMSFTQDETYYILDCKENSRVYLGFQKNIDPEEFHKILVENQEKAKEVDIEKYVQKFAAKKHDLFLIPNGTVHASGKNNLVLEISSAPYIFTFKMYDWLRLDLDGRPRPINIEHGMKNLRFERQGKRVSEELIAKPEILKEDENCRLEHLPTHPEHFYDIYRYRFENEIVIENNDKCHVWMLVEGSSVILETRSGMKQRFNYAETFVIPAAAGSYKITNEGKDKALMVKSFVK